MTPAEADHDRAADDCVRDAGARNPNRTLDVEIEVELRGGRPPVGDRVPEHEAEGHERETGEGVSAGHRRGAEQSTPPIAQAIHRDVPTLLRTSSMASRFTDSVISISTSPSSTRAAG